MVIHKKNVETINMLKFKLERKEEQDHINELDKKGLWKFFDRKNQNI